MMNRPTPTTHQVTAWHLELTSSAVFTLSLPLLAPWAHAEETRPGDEQPARVREIQAALREAGPDGWLFYDFRHSDPLAYRILKLDEKMFASRRWFYYVPASGE